MKPIPTGFTIELVQQNHESEIHVQLLMAVKQCEAWIVRQKIDFDRRLRAALAR
jgi:hypothetical protein